MFKYLKNNEINNFKNHKRSYRKYWFKFMDFKIKDNIWWDCTFNTENLRKIIFSGDIFYVSLFAPKFSPFADFHFAYKWREESIPTAS